MPLCPSCGFDAMRVRRSALERRLFADVFRCRNCGRRSRRLAVHHRVTLRYLFSLSTHCPRCGTADVQNRRKRDKIEAVSSGLLSRLQRLAGAPVRFCGVCRLQYFDWRARRVAPQRQN